MTRFLFVVILMVLHSCSEKSKEEKLINQESNNTDTLRFTEDDRGTARIDFSWNENTLGTALPRDVWVKIKVDGIGKMKKIIEKSNLFLKSESPKLKVKKVDACTFEIFVSKDYEGVNAPDGGKCLTIDSYVQPKKGYIFVPYWNKEGYSFPSSTKTLIHYLPIIDKK